MRFSLSVFFIKQTGASNRLGHAVWITVCSRTAVLEVAFLLLAHLARDADAGSSVGHSSREVLDAGGLVKTCETPHVVLPSTWVIHTDVLSMLFA